MTAAYDKKGLSEKLYQPTLNDWVHITLKGGSKLFGQILEIGEKEIKGQEKKGEQSYIQLLAYNVPYKLLGFIPMGSLGMITPAKDIPMNDIAHMEQRKNPYGEKKK